MEIDIGRCLFSATSSSVLRWRRGRDSTELDSSRWKRRRKKDWGEKTDGQQSIGYDPSLSFGGAHSAPVPLSLAGLMAVVLIDVVVVGGERRKKLRPINFFAAAAHLTQEKFNRPRRPRQLDMPLGLSCCCCCCCPSRRPKRVFVMLRNSRRATLKCARYDSTPSLTDKLPPKKSTAAARLLLEKYFM